jgi:hypothetical protein
MKQHSKHSSEQQQQAIETQAQQKSGQEFATVEELLRFDAAQTQVPAKVFQRIADSAAQIPASPRPWWKKWFGQ